MHKNLDDIFPILDIENDCIVSKQGDITVGYQVELPEIFTLSNRDYEAFHQAWIKAIKALPTHTVFHKQDWFLDRKYTSNYSKEKLSFLSHSSEQFFNERPFLKHYCYILITKKPASRKPSSSLFSNIIRHSIVPKETIDPLALQNFLDQVSQFKHILEDSNYVSLKRLNEKNLLSKKSKSGLIEKYYY